MTEFRQHDRLKVVDASRRGVDAGKVLKKGQIVTAASVKNNTVILEGIENWWFSKRFELVESAVNTDKDGKPLYVGDHVRRHAGEGVIDYRAIVVEQEPRRGGPRRCREDVVVLNKALRGAPRDLVELVRHHWEPETEPKKPFGPIVEGHELAVGAFMVLKRAAALAWGKVDGWSVSGGTQVSVSLWSDGGRETYALNDSRDEDPWRVLLHQPAPKPDHWRHSHWGFDGIEIVELKMPKLDPKAVEEQLRSYARMFQAIELSPPNVWGDRASNHGAGRAVDRPVQLNWDDVVIGSVVQVRVRATGEEFTAEVTESPNGTKKGQEPSPHVHGIWTGTSIVRKCWELLRNDLPVKSWADGSVIRLGKPATAQRELHRIKGAWTDAMTGTVWPDGDIARYSYEIIRDAEKEN